MSIAQLTMPAISPHHRRAAHTVNIINSNPEAALTLLIAVIELGNSTLTINVLQYQSGGFSKNGDPSRRRAGNSFFETIVFTT